MDELSRSRGTNSAHHEQTETEPELDDFDCWFRAAVRNLLTAESASRAGARAEAFLRSLPPSPRPLPRRARHRARLAALVRARRLRRRS